MIDEDVVLVLPWPPTINNYYKVARSGVKYLHKNVREYRLKVDEDIQEQAPGLCIDTPIFMEVYLYPPDSRKRDLDNYMKGLLDALVNTNLLADDSLIDQLFVYRGEVVSDGKVIIEISEAGPIIKRSN